MINKVNNPVFALHCLIKGLMWLGKQPLRKFLIMPILINFVIYAIALGLGIFYINDVIAYLIPEKLHWLLWLLWPLYFFCIAIIGFFSFTMLANLIASPFYGKLSARTLKIIKQNQPSPEPQENAANAVAEPTWLHAMLVELRRIRYLLKWMVLLGIISMIPGLNMLAPLLWAIFGAWGCAFEFFGYALENKSLLFPEQKEFIADVRFGSLSFGGVVLLGLGLPFINLLVAPAAVIAATLYVYEIDELAKVTN